MSRYKGKYFSTADMYELFQEKYPDSDVTFAMFRHVICEFNKKAVDAILEGQTLKMGFGLGYIRVQKIERRFDKPTIDWHETKKLKAQGIDKKVYYTDDYIYHYYWAKKACNIKNKTVYRFDPNKGPRGITVKLARKIRNDDFAVLNYKF
jgi:hypothetical protein